MMSPRADQNLRGTGVPCATGWKGWGPTRPRSRPGRMFFALATVAGLAGEVWATPLRLFEAVPADVVAAYFVDSPVQDRVTKGRPARSIRSAAALAGLLAGFATELGLLSTADASTRLWMDILATAPEILEHPHAVVLMDIQAAPRPNGGHRLARLDAALLIHTADRRSPAGGDNAAIERRIQRFLSTYTNNEESKLSCPSPARGAPCALVDRRLPPWATLAWGPVGNVYVIAIGQNAFRRVADTIEGRSPSAAGDAWFKTAWEQLSRRAGCHLRRPHQSTGAEEKPESRSPEERSSPWSVRAPFVCYANFDRLEHCGDALLAEKIGRVLTALRLGGTDRGLWTIGRNGRAVEAWGYVRRNGEDEFVPITGSNGDSGTAPQPPAGAAAAAGESDGSACAAGVIPVAASGFAVIECDPRKVIEGLCAAYLAGRSPDAQRSSRAFWADLQTRAGVSIGRDILSHLSGRGTGPSTGHSVVIHDYPPHALGLPLAWTILIRINGDADALRLAVDKLLRFSQAELARAGGIQLYHDPDGVWYTQLGIMGPALKVMDDWLVISFSPAAVRRNAEMLSLGYLRENQPRFF